MEGNYNTPIDEAAHNLINFNPYNLCGNYRIGNYNVFYHENRLYSIRCVYSSIVWLVFANSPHDAVMKISKYNF